MNRDIFLDELTALLNKHNAWLSGSVKIREIGGWDASSATVEISETDGFPPYIDTSATFLKFNISPVEFITDFKADKSYVQIVDRDKLLSDGVLSPLDQKTAFHNRRDWGEHLKANGCVEIGNDFNKSTEKKREIKGDFDCRKELAQATHQVMEKHGHWYPDWRTGRRISTR